jgi:hypothetical protein
LPAHCLIAASNICKNYAASWGSEILPNIVLPLLGSLDSYKQAIISKIDSPMMTYLHEAGQCLQSIENLFFSEKNQVWVAADHDAAVKKL